MGECVKGDKLWGDELKGINLKLKDKFWRSNVQRSDYSQPYCIINFRVAKRLDLKCSPHKKEMIIM